MVVVGLGPVRAACRVVHVIGEDDHRGFASGGVPRTVLPVSEPLEVHSACRRIAAELIEKSHVGKLA